jgi:hypothetical protein
MNKEIFDLPSGDLASRRNAISVRESLKSLWANYDVVIINCDKVESLSESYADELFGVLVLQLGYEKFISRVKIQSAKTQVLVSIAAVIKRRKLQMSNSIKATHPPQSTLCPA